MPKLSIIIPMYNEESWIHVTLDKLKEVLAPQIFGEFEIMVVDDKSSDQSIKSVERWQRANSEVNCRIFCLEKNGGKGAAVRAGIEKSNGDIFLIQDADNELDPRDIPSMLDAISHPDIQFVNGSRYLPGPLRRLYAYRRYILNKNFTRLASILVDVRFTDLACGYKLFTKELYESLTLKENRFGFEAEFIIKAARMNRTQIVEVPVGYNPRNLGQGKKIRSMDGLRILWVILKYGLFRMK